MWLILYLCAGVVLLVVEIMRTGTWPDPTSLGDVAGTVVVVAAWPFFLILPPWFKFTDSVKLRRRKRRSDARDRRRAA